MLLLPSTQVDDDVMQAFCSLKNICELDLTCTAISKDSLKVVAQFQLLQKLLLGYTSLRSNDLLPISGLPKLYHLDVSGIGIDQQALEAFGSVGGWSGWFYVKLKWMARQSRFCVERHSEKWCCSTFLIASCLPIGRVGCKVQSQMR